MDDRHHTAQKELIFAMMMVLFFLAFCLIFICDNKLEITELLVLAVIG